MISYLIIAANMFSLSRLECSLLFCTVDSRDQHTLEKLRAERQAKIDELKERTNYYTTQQLIQVGCPHISTITHDRPIVLLLYA
jgi:predicted aconitase